LPALIIKTKSILLVFDIQIGIPDSRVCKLLKINILIFVDLDAKNKILV